MNMSIKVNFETMLTAEELHELLCLAIHEGDEAALNKLREGVADIAL
jgi:hypothetical protein